jgi:hypothetical protein
MTPCGTTTTCTAASTMYTDTTADCSTGPFYTSSVTGYTAVCQACNKSCTSYNGSSETNSIVYGDTACAGPFYTRFKSPNVPFSNSWIITLPAQLTHRM